MLLIENSKFLRLDSQYWHTNWGEFLKLLQAAKLNNYTYLGAGLNKKIPVRAELPAAAAEFPDSCPDAARRYKTARDAAAAEAAVSHDHSYSLGQDQTAGDQAADGGEGGEDVAGAAQPHDSS